MAENNTNNTLLSRSKSANELHSISLDFSTETKRNLSQNEDLFQILYISIAMLESKIDNEYLLAINLLDKVN